MCDDSERHKLVSRYCKEDEVLNRNQVFLVFKAQFLAKQKQIDSNGQNIKMLGKIDSLLDCYTDILY